MGPQVIIQINSFQREDLLTNLLGDLRAYLCPLFEALNLEYAVCVYLQARTNWLAELNEREWGWPQLHPLLCTYSIDEVQPKIGWVTKAGLHATASALNPDGSPEHLPASTRLVMLLDDDSSLSPDLQTSNNICELITHFIGHHLYALVCKLGPERAQQLKTLPFLSKICPIMPHKEKMLWVHPHILWKAINLPAFEEISSGEDVVIATTAWLEDFNACKSVYGLGTFSHLAFESHTVGSAPPPISYLNPEGGLGPFDLYPDVFVEPGAPGSEYFAVRRAAIERVQDGRLAAAGHDLGWPGR